MSNDNPTDHSAPLSDGEHDGTTRVDVARGNDAGAVGNDDPNTAATTPAFDGGARRPRVEREKEWPGAKAALGELFGELGITRVIWVDDQGKSDGVEVAIALTEALVAANGRVGPVYKDRIDNLPTDREGYEIRQRKIREFVENNGPDDVRKLISELEDERRKLVVAKRISTTSDAEAEKAHDVFANAADSLLGSTLRIVSPEEWATEHRDIMQGARKQGSDPYPAVPNTLVLFDMNLGDGHEDGGEQLAHSYLSDYATEKPLSGIISGGISPIDERTTWDDPVHGTVARLSKRDLDESPMEFVAEVKRIVVAPIAREVQKSLIAKMHLASTEALTQVQRVSVTDVVETIELSDAEGVTEADTFRRIHDAYFRTELRTRVWEDAEYQGFVSELRNVMRVARRAKLSERLTTAQYQRRERYEEPTVINRLRLPIAVGDIFEFSPPPGVQQLGAVATQPQTIPPATVRYALLTQTCHTMVRGKGKRVLKVATLALVQSTGGNAEDNGKRYAFLPQYHLDNETAFVDFASTVAVPFCALDLCALNVDGHANGNLEVVPTDGLLPLGWKRYVSDVLMPALRAAVDCALAACPESERSAGITVVDPHGLSPLVMAIAGDGVHVNYNCSRVGRIQEPFATGLLSEFAHYLSHATYEFDMARNA